MPTRRSVRLYICMEQRHFSDWIFVKFHTWYLRWYLSTLLSCAGKSDKSDKTHFLNIYLHIGDRSLERMHNLSKFFPPTDAQLDSLKNNFKFALKFTLKSSYMFRCENTIIREHVVWSLLKLQLLKWVKILRYFKKFPYFFVCRVLVSVRLLKLGSTVHHTLIVWPWLWLVPILSVFVAIEW